MRQNYLYKTKKYSEAFFKKFLFFVLGFVQIVGENSDLAFQPKNRNKNGENITFVMN
jgi:hypothetical protein